MLVNVIRMRISNVSYRSRRERGKRPEATCNKIYIFQIRGGFDGLSLGLPSMKGNNRVNVIPKNYWK